MATKRVDINSDAAKAERRERREMKRARGDFKQFALSTSGTVRVALVRDKNGRPKFDGDPKQLPSEMKDAYGQLMTNAERKEFFG